MCGVKTFELNPEQMWGFFQWRREGKASVGSGNSSDTGMGLHALQDVGGAQVWQERRVRCWPKPGQVASCWPDQRVLMFPESIAVSWRVWCVWAVGLCRGVIWGDEMEGVGCTGDGRPCECVVSQWGGHVCVDSVPVQLQLLGSPFPPSSKMPCPLCRYQPFSSS